MSPEEDAVVVEEDNSPPVDVVTETADSCNETNNNTNDEVELVDNPGDPPIMHCLESKTVTMDHYKAEDETITFGRETFYIQRGEKQKGVAVQYLKKFCVNNNVRRYDGKSLRTATKKIICTAIKAKKERMESGQLDPYHPSQMQDVKSEKKNPKSFANRFRLANVVFANEDIAEELLGINNKRPELDVGMKPEQQY